MFTKEQTSADQPEDQDGDNEYKDCASRNSAEDTDDTPRPSTQERIFIDDTQGPVLEDRSGLYDFVPIPLVPEEYQYIAKFAGTAYVVAKNIGKAVLSVLSEDSGGLKPTPVSIGSEVGRTQKDWDDQLTHARRLRSDEERLQVRLERKRAYAERQQADGRQHQTIVQEEQAVVGEPTAVMATRLPHIKYLKTERVRTFDGSLSELESFDNSIQQMLKRDNLPIYYGGTVRGSHEEDYEYVGAGHPEGKANYGLRAKLCAGLVAWLEKTDLRWWEDI